MRDLECLMGFHKMSHFGDDGDHEGVLQSGRVLVDDLEGVVVYEIRQHGLGFQQREELSEAHTRPFGKGDECVRLDGIRIEKPFWFVD